MEKEVVEDWGPMKKGRQIETLKLKRGEKSRVTRKGGKG